MAPASPPAPRFPQRDFAGLCPLLRLVRDPTKAGAITLRKGPLRHYIFRRLGDPFDHAAHAPSSDVFTSEKAASPSFRYSI